MADVEKITTDKTGIRDTMVENITGRIRKISGPIVVAEDLEGAFVGEHVEVGDERLVGEVVKILEDGYYIQVYEDTTGVKPGEPVYRSGEPLSITLGPGLVGAVLDGLGRRLDFIKEKVGAFITRGMKVSAIPDKTWNFKPLVEKGEAVLPGQIIGEVEETEVVVHKILLPPDVKGVVDWIKEGEVSINEPVASVSGREVFMWQRWPVKKPRPVRDRVLPSLPLFTGQRVIDFFFPIAKGGVAAIPGGFGTGKTMLQHQLAKWSDADVVVYIGCGERGNEMTQVLKEFPELKDPRTGKSIMNRTILIANTSNMPVTAREASIYTGITIAEYFRDMGYSVALMADSTSRWAEALRELAGRLEEMPAEEGFPAYLAAKLAQFYERAGEVQTLSGLRSSVTVVGAVSPPGGDFSEPVTMHTKRFIGCFWALSKELAYARHYPAVSWTESYSEYADYIKDKWEKDFPRYSELRQKFLEILAEDTRLQQVVKLVGPEALPDSQRLVLEVARLIKEAFLQQNAMDPVDTYCSASKQYLMAQVIELFAEKASEKVNSGTPVAVIINDEVVGRIRRMKFEDESSIQNLLEFLKKW